MYIPITEDNSPYSSEGFIVRFFKADGTDWVANFKPGWTECSIVKYFPDTERVLVIAKGMGYEMNPEIQRPINTFGISISFALELENGNILTSDDIGIEIYNGNGLEWQSPRISWDGIKDLTLKDNILTGISLDPMNDLDEWSEFSINLVTKEIKGGSYRRYNTDNNKPVIRKPWWKIWN